MAREVPAPVSLQRPPKLIVHLALSSILTRINSRYHVPWGVIAACYVICPLLLLLQRHILDKENKRRDQEPPDTTYDDVWVKITDANGDIVEKKVDKAFLDLTDRQNRDFRYVL